MMRREGAHRRAALIVNARARRGEHYAAKARRLLQAQGVEVAGSYALRSPARLPETVHTALGRGHDLIILGGGDGTISAVVDDLAHHHAVLGVLPLGTANDFVRTLGIPTDLAEACATIAHGTVVDIDLGLADDNYYVNVASIGLGAATIKALSPRLKRVAGTLAYPLATAHAFLGFEPFAATLTFPRGDHPAVTLPRLLQIAVGNGRFYGGGIAVAPQAGIDDGRLDVYAIAWGDWRDLLGVLRSFKSGHFVQHETVHYYQTACVRIDTERPLPTNVDGELVDQTPVLFALARDALQVLVPQGAPGVDQEQLSPSRAAHEGKGDVGDVEDEQAHPGAIVRRPLPEQQHDG
jgi:YegS/Rv2252/BmrU family lipid kinase